jgi:hypothetical protein
MSIRYTLACFPGSTLEVIVTFTPDPPAPAQEFRETFVFKKEK